MPRGANSRMDSWPATKSNHLVHIQPCSSFAVLSQMLLFLRTTINFLAPPAQWGGEKKVCANTIWILTGLICSWSCLQLGKWSHNLPTSKQTTNLIDFADLAGEEYTGSCFAYAGDVIWKRTGRAVKQSRTATNKTTNRRRLSTCGARC